MRESGDAGVARGPARRMGAALGATTTLAAALGLLVGVRSVVALEPSGVRGLLSLPTAHADDLGLRWSARAEWPAALQATALERLASVVAALLLAAALVAALDTLVLLVEAGSSRRREMAIRAAVGAPPGSVAALLVRDVRTLLAAGLAVGLVVGMAGAGLLRVTWPGTWEDPGWAGALGTVLAWAAGMTGAAALAYVQAGWAVARGRALAPVLQAGSRASADRPEVFRRRLLAAFQMGMAGAVTLGAIPLALAVRDADRAAGAAPDTVAVPARLPAGADGWGPTLARLGTIEGIDVATVASEGALTGLGVRDYLTAQCGECYRGGLPLPFWGARADHHAAGPGYFEAAGIRVVAGRALSRADAPGRRPVAVVNRTLAANAFEDGDPLGRLVRLGSGFDAWYEVVGVVDAPAPAVVGGAERPREAVWVSALQHPPRTGWVLLRGRPEGVAGAVGALDAAGIRQGDPMTLAEMASRAAAPLRWGALAGGALALVTLALALGGVHVTSVQATRRRGRELATRRALGAADRRILAYVLAEGARTALAGAAVALFFGSLLVAVLRRAAAGVPAPGPGVYAAVTLLLVACALAASVRAGLEALAVEPASVLE